MSGGIQEIIEETRKPATGQVELGKYRYTVRVPRSASELIAIEKIVGGHVRALEAGKCTPEQKRFLPQSKDVLRLAAWVSQVTVEPKVTLAEALQLASESGAFFLQLAGQVMTVIGMAAEDAAEEAVDLEGEGSSLPAGSLNGPSSPETCTDGPLKN